MTRFRATSLALALLILGCAQGPPGPAAIIGGVGCTHCRMAVSDAKLAAQIVAPGEDPRFFDDIGCLAAYLKEHQVGASAVAYVADHASGSWILANSAVYSRGEQLSTPMGSHLIAHGNDAARTRDGSASGTARLSARDVFGAAGAPAGVAQ